MTTPFTKFIGPVQPETPVSPLPTQVQTKESVFGRAHTFGHDVTKRQGKCRNSGHPGAHRIGGGRGK
jgi:hypothetical protein